MTNVEQRDAGKEDANTTTAFGEFSYAFKEAMVTSTLACFEPRYPVNSYEKLRQSLVYGHTGAALNGHYCGKFLRSMGYPVFVWLGALPQKKIVAEQLQRQQVMAETPIRRDVAKSMAREEWKTTMTDVVVRVLGGKAGLTALNMSLHGLLMVFPNPEEAAAKRDVNIAPNVASVTVAHHAGHANAQDKTFYYQP